MIVLLRRNPVLPLAVPLWLALPLAGAAVTPYDSESETTYRRVRWEDFKGDSRGGGRWSAASTAHIATLIKLSPYEPMLREEGDGWLARDPGLEAYAVMDKYLSGAASRAREDRVLAHEQLHFDLTEAHARRLTRRLRGLETVAATPDDARRALQHRILDALRETEERLDQSQAQYDLESRHGTDRRGQREWARRIAAMLDEE